MNKPEKSIRKRKSGKLPDNQGKSKAQTAKDEKKDNNKSKFEHCTPSISSSASIKSIPSLDVLIGKWLFPITLILMVSMIVFIFRNFLFHKYAYIFLDIGSDTFNLHYPNWLLRKILSTQKDFLDGWSFYNGMGQSIGGKLNGTLAYILNIPNAAMQYPFRLIAKFNDWNTLPYNVVYNQCSNIILTGTFFYLYMRTMGITGYACLIGCLLFTFSGYVILGSSWYHSHYGLRFVFLLFAFEQWFCKKRWYFLPYAFYLLSGYLYYLYGLFMVIYAIFRLIESRWESKYSLIFFTRSVGLAVLGILMSASNIISTFLRILTSPRGSGLFDSNKAVVSGVSHAQSLSSHPMFGFDTPIHYITVIMRLFSNDLLGNGSNFNGWRNYLEAPALYCGLITLILLPQIFLLFGKREKLVYGSFFLIWVMMIIFPYFRYAYYFFTGNYYKQALDYIIPLVLILFAARSLHEVLVNRKRLNTYLLVAMLILCLIALFFPYFQADKNIVDKQLQMVVAFFLVLYTVILLSINHEKLTPYMQILLVLTIIVEVGYFANVTVNRRTAVTPEELNKREGYNDYSLEAVEYLQKIDKNFYRIEKDYVTSTAKYTSTNDQQAQGYYGTMSYSSFNQVYYIRFLQEIGVIPKNNEPLTRWAYGVYGRPHLHAFASVKYLLSKEANLGAYNAYYEQIHKIKDVRILKNRYYLPLGFTYDRYIRFEEYTKLTESQKHFYLLQACVIENSDLNKFTDLKEFPSNDVDQLTRVNNYKMSDYGNDAEKLRQESLTITEHKNGYGYFKGEITTSDKKLLFFSIPYDKGWHATVDGKNVPIHLANIGFMGILLDKGKHTIEMRYIVPYQREGNLVCGISLGLFLILLGNTGGRALYEFWKTRKSIAIETD